MKKIMNWLETGFAPKMNKFANNPWISSIKDTVNQKNITIPENEIIYAQADNIYAEVVTAQGIFLYSIISPLS